MNKKSKKNYSKKKYHKKNHSKKKSKKGGTGPSSKVVRQARENLKFRNQKKGGSK